MGVFLILKRSGHPMIFFTKMEVKTNLSKVNRSNNDKTLSTTKMGIQKIKDNKIWNLTQIDETQIKAFKCRNNHTILKNHMGKIKIKEVIDRTFKWIKVRITNKVNAV